MAELKIPRWSDFQQYKDRDPAWIKLHRRLLDDPDFWQMSVDARALLPMLWLVASEKQGSLISQHAVEWRLRAVPGSLGQSLKELAAAGFIDANGTEFTTETIRTNVRTGVCTDQRTQVCSTRREEKRREEKNIQVEMGGFDQWWSAYPKKVGKKRAMRAWCAGKFWKQSEKLIADVERRKTDDDRWARGYAPNPLTYLNGELWEDELVKAPKADRVTRQTIEELARSKKMEARPGETWEQFEKRVRQSGAAQ